MMKKAVVAVVLGVVLLAVGAGLVLYTRSSSNPLPENIRKSVSFPIYYPSPAPKGYSFDPASPKASGDLLVYTFKDGSGKAPITMTFQPIPKDFNTTKVFNPKITPATAVPIGNQYNLSIGQQSKYVIVTDDGTLIFITSPAKIPGSAMHALVTKLELIKS